MDIKVRHEKITQGCTKFMHVYNGEFFHYRNDLHMKVGATVAYKLLEGAPAGYPVDFCGTELVIPCKEVEIVWSI